MELYLSVIGKKYKLLTQFDLPATWYLCDVVAKRSGAVEVCTTTDRG